MPFWLLCPCGRTKKFNEGVVMNGFGLKCAVVGAVLSALGANMASTSPLQITVDKNHMAIQNAVDAAGFEIVTSIDHARIAAAEGVEMPPSRVIIFSDPEVNEPILRENIRTGLDLPFRALSYAQDGSAQVIFTGSDFLQMRHGLTDISALEDFEQKLNGVAENLNAVAASINGLTRGYGIFELKSKLSVPEAVTNLTEIVKAQDDTIWFGEIDFPEDPSEKCAKLPKAVLLLFGGPAPGGLAMAGFPAIGLDAFCQKLLVYAGEDGGSVVIFNDIAALAELHYGASTKSHHLLNERLTATFVKAIQ
ncbi:MAG: DUF302 domain-containing protein [Erythrobacter sp.]|uniref:DUF302 domain-containing protein n=1 Tax=Erythrobacter sp. TaxID=1042 RepID=UPI003297C4BC